MNGGREEGEETDIGTMLISARFCDAFLQRSVTELTLHFLYGTTNFELDVLWFMHWVGVFIVFFFLLLKYILGSCFDHELFLWFFF